MTARALLARALGVAPDDTGSHCALCGKSPFPIAGPVRRTLGNGFTDYADLSDPAAESICTGCARCLSGRPGDDPPPLRTVSVLAAPGVPLRVLDREAWWRLLIGEEPTPTGCVLSWATSRKRHHWLRAGVSTPQRWLAGCDDGTIDWRPDAEVPAAVLSLLTAGASKGAILAGRYPVRLLAEHRACIEDAERVLANVRGQLLLDLVVWAAPRAEHKARPEETVMIDPGDRLASDLLADLVWHSELRAEEGLQFWGGYLLRRLRRFSRLPLAQCVSRLLSECRVGIQGAATIAQRVESASEEDAHAIETALRERPDLIHALAFGRVQGIREERKRKRREPSPAPTQPSLDDGGPF